MKYQKDKIWTIKKKTKRLRNSKRISNNIYLVIVPQVKNRGKTKVISKEEMTVNFLEPKQIISLYIEEQNRNLSRLGFFKSISKHCNETVKLKKKQKIQKVLIQKKKN